MVGSSSQQRQLITYHVEFTEEEHPQPAPSPEHSLAYRRPTGGGRQVQVGCLVILPAQRSDAPQ